MSTPLKPLIVQLIKETIDEHYLITGQAPNEQGNVSAVNDDGTVDVQTPSGCYSGCGTTKTRILGETVTLVTADGQRIAI